MTMSPVTKARLEQLAKMSGRSVSQTAELAIERGRLLGELETAGPAVEDALMAMLAFAVRVKAEIDDPSKSFAGRDALKVGWGALAGRVIPYGIDQTDAGDRARRAQKTLELACSQARRALHDSGLQSANRQLAVDLRDLGTGQLPATSEQWASARARIEEQSTSLPQLGEIVRPVLEAMREAELGRAPFLEARRNARERARQLLEEFMPDTDFDDPGHPGAQ